ncbi:hypothetical protein F7X37_00255 [Candidatus Ecksteinia adelgidicola]|nr:hypothetical protein F7X37_00255 [Candidatus Ecksteinia adelgidicola]
MIRSMTAYAQYEVKEEWGVAIWEIRSINQRYLEISIRLPDKFRSLESEVRQCIRNRLSRGKVECSLHVNINSSLQKPLVLNKNLVKKLLNAIDWIKTQSKEGTIDLIKILYWPGVMYSPQQNFELINTDLFKALDHVLYDFIASRIREGTVLKNLINQRLCNVSEVVVKIRKQMPNVLKWQRNRLLNKLEEAQIQLENTRLEQEIVLIAHRIDVQEELDRIEGHVHETHNLLIQKTAVGRHLDFMMQELNREANTLACKSINIDITTLAVELKVLIEQMREQIQNIE